jgi:hypothetical protein
LLDEGRVSGLREIAEAEGTDIGRASRIMRLTQLAPEIIEAALRRESLAVGLSELLGWFPERWDVQLSHSLGGASHLDLHSRRERVV